MMGPSAAGNMGGGGGGVENEPLSLGGRFE